MSVVLKETKSHGEYKALMETVTGSPLFLFRSISDGIKFCKDMGLKIPTVQMIT